MAGYAGLGTILTIALVPVAELTSIGGPSVSADTIDVSAHHDPTGAPFAYREYVAGLLDGGEVSMEGNLTDAAAANVVLTALNSRAEQAIAITFPATVGAAWGFQGIVTGFETSAPHDGKLGFSASIKVTGRPTIS